jgi:hypothetical protein
MNGRVGVLQLMLGPTMDTRSLHHSNLTPTPQQELRSLPLHVAKVISNEGAHKPPRAEAAHPLFMLALKIPIQAEERLWRNIFRVRN